MFLVTPDENIYWGIRGAYGIANGYEGVLCYHVVIEWVYMLRLCTQGEKGCLLDKRSL